MVRNCSDNISLVHVVVVVFPGFNWYSELGQKQFIISTMIPNIFRANNPRQKRMPMTSVQAEVQKMCAVSSGRVRNQPSAAFYYLISHEVQPRKRSLISSCQTDRQTSCPSRCLSVCVFRFSRTWPWRVFGPTDLTDCALYELQIMLSLAVCVCVARIETWNGADNDNGFSGSGLGSSNAIRLPRAQGDCRGRCAAASGSDRHSHTHKYTHIHTD